MNIRIICLGKIKEKYLHDGIEEYKKRISKYANIEIIELSDEPIPDNASQKEIDNIKKKEADKIKNSIDSHDFVCSLDLSGKQLTSEEFANKINEITLNGFSTIDFIIGGSLGIHKELVTNSNMAISFSKLTFPHQLFRMILLEQIYRAFKINNNETYHK
ncbi:MAG: 23S rRNA (pseudouridine(1915)-N(3))-methyltransferase RlmH [Clostridia bacterium]|nr:23S rRNA (pseudouridine(1915)-N(3))-methyltransferase RlmH [Clostridia bacterium]